ncbi:hypothetical protein D9613_009177 [Agrocybe pediades]|uniref:Transcription and mRNA export factor SUS1 n=1 Tax=Agrocybe pediades TaxID=84607 RepID=A0A8H4R257_9AGAR|nr:hypothetical protein D9613_009177 [Agrocybe pediades]KAF9565447.1 hypothetical protein CPC08DRAFT_704702 [Agrocybe pediades]
MPQPDINYLYNEIRRRLVESGDWDLIRSVLSAKLNESGWIDDVHHKSKETARNMDPLSFKQLHAEFVARTEPTVPLAAKREVSALIRQQIEKHFE